MNELAKAKGRILGKIEMYIGDIEFAQERELTEDEKTIFESVKDIIREELDDEELDEPSSDTEQIIKTTIKEYLDKFYLDTNELLIDLNHDLCKHIRCKEAQE